MATKEKIKDKSKDKSKKDDRHRPRKTTKLHEACVSGDLELVDTCLIKHKSWLNTPNDEGRYPIHLACLHGQQAVVERLLKVAGVFLAEVLNQIEDRPGRWCVLHYAAHSRNKELFFFLASHPEIKVVGHTNRDKNTPLHYFSRFFDTNHKNVLNLLTRKGADVDAQNQNGETPLHNACWGGHLEIVHVLLDLGANPNLQNDHGETALHWAARMGFDKIVEVLLKSSADRRIKGQNGLPVDVSRSESVKRLLDPDVAAEAKKQLQDMEQKARNLIEQKRVTPFHWEINYSDLKFLGRIGSGGAGVVHKGTWKGIDVAIKMLPYTDVSADAFESLVHEITIMSKLRHSNILLFLGACLSPKICIITELMPRGSLRDVVRSQQLSWTRKLNFAIEITRGLQYLHSQTPPVLHRDLKTLNILVDEAFHIKLADFGATSAAVSRETVPDPVNDACEPSSSTTPQSLAASENYGGTLYCLAPEVLDHQPYTPASDVYSLGLVFWELACGKVPFEGISNMRLLRAIEEGAIEELRTIDSSCPADYAALVTKCISKSPTDRPTLDEVMTALKACKGSQVSH